MAIPNGYDGATFSTTTDDEEERKETDKLRKALFEDFTMFLLNNILMSVQFFDNYEREMMQLRETCLDETILDSGHFHVFDADTLHNLISSKIMYQRSTGASKTTPELLHPLRTYITYQNVELANNATSLGAKERVQYNPSYRLIVQRCEDDRKEVSGYVNVVAPPTLTEEKPDVGFGGGTLIYHPDGHDEENKDSMKKPIQSNVLLSKNDTFYMLEPGKRCKPYPLTSYRTYERISQLAAIPNSCFKEHEKQFLGNQRRRAGVVLGKTRKGKITQKILISAAFKRHFSEVFSSHLASHLDIDKVKLDKAIFHLDRVIVRKQHAIHHVIPLLEMKEWPNAIPTELFKDDKGNAIQWPTKTMQTTINKLGCSLVPIGYHEPTNENGDYTLEWKIDCPKVEKYLTMHMMHTHIRCYLFTLILYKTFIGTDESAPHFGPSHILNLLFLMVRKNFLAWPEYSQGETLTRYLRILERTLQKKCLKSFFLSNRNLYDNSPQRVLHRAQTIIMRILQNPIAYILKAFINLKYKDDTHPQLDYLKLYNILTVKNLMDYLHPEPPKNIKTRKNQTQPEPEPLPLGRNTINEDEFVQENNTPLHREEVLRLFIEHFINIAHRSRKNQNYDNSMLYLIHARRLTTILSEESATRGEIQDFSERIQNGILHCTKTGVNNDDKTGTIPPKKDIINAKPGRSLRTPLLNAFVTQEKQAIDEATRL